MSDPFADWGDRTALPDTAGRPVLFYSASESVQQGTPWADAVWVPPAVSTEHAARAALHAFAGWRFSTSDRDLAAALTRLGATERRHAHSMTHDLRNLDGSPPGNLDRLRVEPLSPAQVHRHALRLGRLNLLAYPADHPDAFDGDEAAAVSQIRAIARGELLGPMLAESRVAVADQMIVGACLVVDRPGAPPHAGPWVIDVFRDQAERFRGVGAALVDATLRAAGEAGLPGVSLTVSNGNHGALRLYQRVGFRAVDESWTLELPSS